MAATEPKQIDPLWERELAEIFGEHYTLMYRGAYSVLGSGRGPEAEDVIQTLFLRFLQHELRSDVRKDPKGYLYRAAVNESLNLIRSEKRRKESNGLHRLDPSAASTDDTADRGREILQDAVAQLSAETVEILILHYEHGFSGAEIAAMRGESRGAIAMTLSRARKKLQTLINDANGVCDGIR